MTIARIAAWMITVLVVASCGPVTSTTSSDIAMNGVDVAFDVTVTETFAAMDEVPVSGGELRLVAPLDAGDRDGDALKAIAFPLRHTDVRTRVSGMSAIYAVEQTFENPYDEPIDAVYVFPLGDEAAVTSYAIVIGDRTIAGEIKTKDDARATYANARAQGHTAALLEQDKRNIFRQRIANIAPREPIKVRFEYVELLDYADGHYEIAFPLVVGPRYLPANDLGKTPVGAHHAGDRGRDGVVSIPYADPSIAASTVSFAADIDAGVPITGVASPSHQLRVSDVAATRRRVELATAGELPNRDLIVRFKTASESTMVGLLAHRTTDRGYFTLVVQPKAEYKTGDITPREVMIVVDTSGSMSGQPIAQAQRLASALVDSLGPADTFNVLAFAGGSHALAPAAIAGDPAGKRLGKQFIVGLSSGGGTEMGPAMATALATDPGMDRVRLVYFLTDGFVGNDDVIVSAARNNLGVNRIFSVGIGSAPNRSLLNQIAAVGRGFASYLGPDESAADLGEDLVRRTAFPYLTNIKIHWNGLAVGAVTPERIPDVYAGLPLVVSGVYTRPGRAKVVVSATRAGRAVSIPLEVTLPARSDAEPVAALWARRRVDELLAIAGDQVTDTVAAQITELGLGFHMVTDYTSFVAVDRTRVVTSSGATKLVEQPALAPAGINLEAAIGEPSESSSGYSGYAGGGGGGGGGGGWGGGGDVDPLTLLLMIALVPLAWTLRRIS
ncbi:MAG: VIT domain-containing protein [Kofleriaceae bacterium]